MNIINNNKNSGNSGLGGKLRNNSNATLPASVTSLTSSSVRTLNNFHLNNNQDVESSSSPSLAHLLAQNESKRKLKMLDDIKVTLESIMFDNRGKLYSNWSTHTWQNYSAIMTIFCRHILAVLEDGIKVGGAADEAEDLSSMALPMPPSSITMTNESKLNNDLTSSSLSSSSQSSSQPSKCSTSPTSTVVNGVDDNNISSQLIWSFVLSIFNMDDEDGDNEVITDEDTGFVLASKHNDVVKGENQAKKDFNAAHKQMIKNLSEQHPSPASQVDQFAVSRRESLANAGGSRKGSKRRSILTTKEQDTYDPETAINSSALRMNPNVNMALEWISTSLRHYTLLNQLTYILMNDKNRRLMQMYYKPSAFLLDEQLASDFLVYIKAYEQRDHAILNQVKLKTTLLIHNHNQQSQNGIGCNRRTSSVKSSSQLNPAGSASGGSFSPSSFSSSVHTNGTTSTSNPPTMTTSSMPIQPKQPGQTATSAGSSSSVGSDIPPPRRPHADTQSSTSSQVYNHHNSSSNLMKHSSSSSAFLFENDQTASAQTVDQQQSSELTNSLLELHINELNAKNAVKNTRMLSNHRRMHSFPNIQINMQKRNNMLLTSTTGPSTEAVVSSKENEPAADSSSSSKLQLTVQQQQQQQVPRFVLNNEIKEVDDLISNDDTDSVRTSEPVGSKEENGNAEEDDVFTQTTVFDFIQAQQIHCDRSVLDKENSHFILADIAVTAMEFIKTQDLDEDDEDEDGEVIYESSDYKITFGGGGRPVEKSRLETIQDEPEPSSSVERTTLRKRQTSTTVGIDIKQPSNHRNHLVTSSKTTTLDTTQIIDLSVANSFTSTSFYAAAQGSPSLVQPIFLASGDELISSSFEQQHDPNSMLLPSDDLSMDISLSSPSNLTSSYSETSKSQQKLKKERWLATKPDVENSLSVESGYFQDRGLISSYPGTSSSKLATAAGGSSTSNKSFQLPSFDSASNNDDQLDGNSVNNASMDNTSFDDSDAQYQTVQFRQKRQMETSNSRDSGGQGGDMDPATSSSRLNEARHSTVSTTSQRTRRFSWEEIENMDTAERIAIRLIENTLAYYRRLRPNLLVSRLARDSAGQQQQVLADVPTLRQFELFIQNIEFEEYMQAYYELRSSGKLKQFYEALAQTRRHSKLSQAHQHSLSASTIFLSHSSSDFSSSTASKKSKEPANGTNSNNIFSKLFSKSNTSVAKTSSPAQLVKTAALAAAAATSLNQLKLLAAENDPISLVKNQQLQDQAVSSLRGMESIRKRLTTPLHSNSSNSFPTTAVNNATAFIRQLSQSNFNDYRQNSVVQENLSSSSVDPTTNSSYSSPASRMSIYNNIKALNARIIGDDVWAPVREQLILNKSPKIKRAEVMAQQQYRCADCGVNVNPDKMNTFNYCEYFCKYFCRCCHINNTSYIPAYIVQSSDFHTNYKVSKKAKSFLEKIYNEPLIALEGLNPQLFADSRNIYSKLKRLRLKLNNSKRYIYSCRFAFEIKQRLEANFDDFIIENADVYSISSLFKFKEGDFYERLKQLVLQIIEHIRACELCRQQGFVCEICKRESDILYPFDFDRVEKCPNCLSCFHKACFKSPDQCLRCKRKKDRNQSIVIPGAHKSDAATV